MKKTQLIITALLLSSATLAQTDPMITSWLINTNGTTGMHYVSGNSTPVNDTAHVNVQQIRYSTNYVYVNSSGVPAYIVGPFLDGNPSQATNNDWLFKIPRSPQQNTGTLTNTPLGAIGVWINGVLMYDYKDGASYNSSTGQDDMQNGDGVWNRNAVFAENDGFDCSKGHPSPVTVGPPGPGGTLVGGSYHHHQNPTAFNLDMVTVSSICDTYVADGLYTLDSTQHGPLIGYAFDGYPVYGGYGYAVATDANSGFKRMEPSYHKRNITVRNTYADGSSVTAGPNVSTSFPLGCYREDYEFIQGSGDLDEHNGRYCVTPEYPNGTYAYFATVNSDWTSAYPYIIGPTYYGVVVSDNFTMNGNNSVTVTETTSTYTPTVITESSLPDYKIVVFPNPAADLVAIQVEGLLRQDISASLYDMDGKLIKTFKIIKGSTIWHIDASTLYSGNYILQLSDGIQTLSKQIVITK